MWVQRIPWLGLSVVSAPAGATQMGGRFPFQGTDQQVLTQRLGTDDSYWWILAGGIYVPGFGPSAEPGEGPSPDEVPPKTHRS